MSMNMEHDDWSLWWIFWLWSSYCMDFRCPFHVNEFFLPPLSLQHARINLGLCRVIPAEYSGWLEWPLLPLSWCNSVLQVTMTYWVFLYFLHYISRKNFTGIQWPFFSFFSNWVGEKWKDEEFRKWVRNLLYFVVHQIHLQKQRIYKIKLILIFKHWLIDQVL